MTKLPRQLLLAMMMEGVGTTQMMHTYARQGTGKLNLIPAHRNPTREELNTASEQLKEIPRYLLFLVFFLIPVPGFVGGYALVAISIEKKFGAKVKLLPTRLRPLFTTSPAQ